MDFGETGSTRAVCALSRVCVSVCMFEAIEGGWAYSFHYFSRVCNFKNIKREQLLFKRKIFKPNLRGQGLEL